MINTQLRSDPNAWEVIIETRKKGSIGIFGTTSFVVIAANSKEALRRAFNEAYGLELEPRNTFYCDKINKSSGLKPGSLDEALEADIDRNGLAHTITRLELLCGEKAQHIAMNGTQDDKQLALVWKLFSVKLGRLATTAAERLP